MKCIFSCSQSLAKSCHLSSIKLNVIRELSLINESLPLWPMFFPSFMEFSSPNLYFTIFLSLQVTLKLAIKIGFLFRGADPPFSHNEKGKGEESDEEYVSLSTWAWWAGWNQGGEKEWQKRVLCDNFNVDLDNHKLIINILKKWRCQYIIINRSLAYYYFFFDKKAGLCQYESRYSEGQNLSNVCWSWIISWITQEQLNQTCSNFVQR